MVRHEADWKEQDSQIFNWIIALVVILLVVINLYQWWQGSGPNAALAVGLGAWGLLYFTGYWQPILYLVAAAVLSGATLTWFWRGTWDEAINLLTIIFSVLFISLSVYLFLAEELWSERDAR